MLTGRPSRVMKIKNEVTPALRQQPGVRPPPQEGDDAMKVKGPKARALIQADPVMERIDRAAERVTVDRGSGCWIIDGEPDKYHSIYGKPAHRWFWRMLRGPIQPGFHIHHKCERPGCVNPDHLIPVSPARHARLHRLARGGDELFPR
jgi:hypothetical protein